LGAVPGDGVEDLLGECGTRTPVVQLLSLLVIASFLGSGGHDVREEGVAGSWPVLSGAAATGIPVGEPAAAERADRRSDAVGQEEDGDQRVGDPVTFCRNGTM
jgi:hypothetical protein